MTTLLDQHTAFIQRAKSLGAKTLKYKTPCCKKELEDRVAPKGSNWDSMCTCPHCGEHYMKLTSDKRIVGRTFPAGAA